MHTFTKKIKTALQSLLPAESHILVGVSGGADSVSLLYALWEIKEESLKTEKLKGKNLKLEISVAHLNHGIRAEAAADALFVKNLCREMELAFHTAAVDVPSIAAKNGISLEMAARGERYKFFAETAAKCGASAVSTAHTLDDQAETILLKLCRGAGSAGLDGIAPQTDIAGLKVIRPMLKISRAEVEQFLRDNGIPRVEDATNADTRFKRNLIRHELLPMLAKHINPRVKEALARTADIMRDDNSFMEEQAHLALEAVLDSETGNIRIMPLLKRPSAIKRRVLRQWLIINGLVSQQMRFDLIERIMELVSADKGSGSVTISANRAVKRKYSELCFIKKQHGLPRIKATELIIPGKTYIKSHGLLITTTLRSGFERKAAGTIGKLPADAVISWNTNRKISVRSWNPGDRIQPLGMRGSRKLQDLFSDAKIPKEDRHNIPLFISGDEVVWIPGYRISRSVAVADGNQPSLEIKVENASKFSRCSRKTMEST